MALPLVANWSWNVRLWAGTAGSVLIVYAMISARENVAWPGYAALLPCLGTLALVMAGSYGPGPLAQMHPIGRLLSARPMVWLGGMSYSWYLWHWPFIVFARAALPGLSGPVCLAFGIGSLLPAYVTHKLVENPIRFRPVFSRRPMAALAVGALCTAVGLSAGVVTSRASRPVQHHLAATTSPAEVSTSTPQRDWDAILATTSYPTITPDPLAAGADLPAAYATDCRQRKEDVEPRPCLAGDLTSSRTIAMAGDSYIEQWEPAVDRAAKELGIKVVGYYKAACPLTVAAIDISQAQAEVYHNCPTWSRAVVDELIELQPDLVLTSQFSSQALSDPNDPASEGSQAAMEAGVMELWQQLKRAGVPILVLGRNPAGFIPGESYPTIFECVAQNAEDLTKCQFAPDTTTAEWQQAMVRALDGGATYFDLNDMICSPQACPAVIEGVLVYRGGTHINATFAETLTPLIKAELVRHLR